MTGGPHDVSRLRFDGRLRPGDALLVCDVQRDFLDGGAIGVRDGSAIVPTLNAYLAAWRAHGLPIFASRDWHPPDHCSFVERGGAWPRHCVAGTPGAAFADELTLPPGTVVVSKATRRDVEAHSAFDGTALDGHLRAARVRRLFVAGVALDHGVRATVEEAVRRGYEAIVLGDAVRALDRQAGDGRRALTTLRRLGATVVTREMLG